jgi:16S rRNA (adenine1518-N6/adenine1519-N6)-dimethyltransferase
MAGHSRPPAKKSLGQNFLVSEGVAARIVEALTPGSEDLIFEIGPGRGALTYPLSESGAHIVAVEIDSGLAGFLEGAFGDRDNVEIVCSDIREVDLDGAAAARGKERYKIAGNIPYHLTSVILLDLARWRDMEEAVIMVQQEVAERVLARPGERNCGILSVFLQSYLGIERIMRVRPGSFSPRPKVESAVLRFAPLKERVGPGDRRGFLELLKKVFSQRRKKLRSALRGASGTPHARDVTELAEATGTDLDRRPEELDLASWVTLYNGYQELLGRK